MLWPESVRDIVPQGQLDCLLCTDGNIVFLCYIADCRPNAPASLKMITVLPRRLHIKVRPMDGHLIDYADGDARNYIHLMPSVRTCAKQAIRPHVWYLVASHCPTKNKPSPFMRIEVGCYSRLVECCTTMHAQSVARNNEVVADPGHEY